MKRAIFAFLLMLAFSCIYGCNKTDFAPQQQEQSAPKQAVAPKKEFTAAQWNEALHSAFIAGKRNDDSNGTTQYKACFDKQNNDAGKCDKDAQGITAIVDEDKFKHSYLFQPEMSWLTRDTFLTTKSGAWGTIGILISTRECRAPTIGIHPKITLKNWISMDEIAFMADGVVVFDKKLDKNNVSRRIGADLGDGGVTEQAWVVLKDDDIEALRHFSAAKEHIVRITGSEGYVSPDSGVFVSDFPRAVDMLNAISAALKQAGGPECTVAATPILPAAK